MIIGFCTTQMSLLKQFVIDTFTATVERLEKAPYSDEQTSKYDLGDSHHQK